VRDGDGNVAKGAEGWEAWIERADKQAPMNGFCDWLVGLVGGWLIGSTTPWRIRTIVPLICAYLPRYHNTPHNCGQKLLILSS